MALHAVDLAHLRPGMSVGVFGCGPIGLLVLQVARAAGAGPIFVTEPLPHRLAAAVRFGAQPWDGQQSGRPPSKCAGENAAVDDAVDAVRPAAGSSFPEFPASDRLSKRKYAIGVDFGTESGRAVLVDVGNGRRAGDGGASLRQRRHRRAPARLGYSPGAGLGAAGPQRLSGGVQARHSGRPPIQRRRPGRRDRRGHRLHRLHHAALPRPMARRCALCPSGATTRTPGSSCGSTTPPSPRPTRSTPPRASGRALARALWRQDLVRVVLLQGPADPGRSPGSLRRRRPPARGRRLGRLAADRRREAQHCTAGYKAMWSKRDGFPPNEFFKALDPRLEHIVDEKMSRTLYPLGARPAG